MPFFDVVTTHYGVRGDTQYSSAADVATAKKQKLRWRRKQMTDISLTTTTMIAEDLKSTDDGHAD